MKNNLFKNIKKFLIIIIIFLSSNIIFYLFFCNQKFPLFIRLLEFKYQIISNYFLNDILIFWLILLSTTWLVLLFSSLFNKTYKNFDKLENKNSILFLQKNRKKPFFLDYYYTIHQFMFFPIVLVFFIIR